MFIVIDYNDQTATGDTLQDAFEDYEEKYGTLSMDDCTWYEAKEIQVKQKIEKVEQVTITKIPNKSRS